MKKIREYIAEATTKQRPDEIYSDYLKRLRRKEDISFNIIFFTVFGGLFCLAAWPFVVVVIEEFR